MKHIILALGLFAAFTAPVEAHANFLDTVKDVFAKADTGKAFTKEEKAIILEVLNAAAPEDSEEAGKGKGKDKNKTKGKGGKDGLPPGLAKRAELPPGLSKRALPPGLAKRLPARSDGTEIAIVDNDVVLIETATKLVLDVIKDAAN